MPLYTALAILEGLETCDDNETFIDAAQSVWDSGAAFTLPGRVGRMVADMVAQGIISE